MTKIMRFALVFSVLWFAPQAQAQGATYLNEAVQALQSGNVYVSVAVTDVSGTTKQQLDQQAKANNVAVVVLPGTAASEAGSKPAQFALKIATLSGKDTLVVSIGGDLTAVSRTLPGGSAAKLADQAESGSGSTGDALLTFIGEVREVRAESPGSQPSAASDGSSGLGIFVVIAVALVAAGLASSRLVKTRGKRSKSPRLKYAPKNIRELLSQVEAVGARIDDSVIQQSLSEAVQYTVQLFWRLYYKPDQARDQAKAYDANLTNLLGNLMLIEDVEKNKADYAEADAVLKGGREGVQHYAMGARRNVHQVTNGALADFDLRVELLSDMNPSRRLPYRSSQEQQ